ncbi:glucosamine-6-phosphate deaminase [Blautia producta]|uniref:Glucosamine-6-phosphate deaminase n=1 Tax=Blautia producta TaxID=33035 RepID=A0ABZ0UHR6_9FIRM|nr:glucosamine-6-phosphate deaminase [Blautia coccoides]TCO61481.1 glucosamine-6-phosphate deaminase [Blautia coccoides]WPX76822.1 Glucosamine-6-phosphate deaminase [Blautia coccoides]SUY03020.1 glucosamine-6-phosphate deaminase NagB [Blautia coccoides]
MKKICRCPYIPCKHRNHCTACIIHNKEDKTLPNCMEEIDKNMGACLPIKIPATEVMPDMEGMSRRCAQLVKECLDEKKNALLCFPAGSTVVRTCEILKEMKEQGVVDFSQAEFVALDEWLDLEEESENCTNFLMQHLYGPLGIQPEKMHLFDIHAENLQDECKRIDSIIFDRGGIDLMLLGLGMNGHLGLNEPGGDFEDYAKVVDLSETTMNVGQKYFSGPMKLTRGITLGVHHMFEAKKVILQVSGKAKQDIVKEMYYTNPTEELPGTVLKLLPGGLVVLDQDAAEGIQNLLAES